MILVSGAGSRCSQWVFRCFLCLCTRISSPASSARWNYWCGSPVTTCVLSPSFVPGPLPRSAGSATCPCSRRADLISGAVNESCWCLHAQLPPRGYEWYRVTNVQSFPSAQTLRMRLSFTTLPFKGHLVQFRRPILMEVWICTRGPLVCPLLFTWRCHVCSFISKDRHSKQ
jgi:hypothetical protein